MTQQGLDNEGPTNRPHGSRGLFSTILISFFLSAFAGYLWIGRGRAALLFALATICLVLLYFLATLYGIFSVDVGLGQPESWGWGPTLVIGALSLLIVLPFRKSSASARWYSRGWWVGLLLIAYLLAFAVGAMAIRSLLVHPFSIPSSAMSPTLIEGDHLAVSKTAYGYSRHSFPLSLGPFSGRIFAKEPRRGDIVVFKYPKDTNLDYIMRIVGLPGEVVRMVDGVLHINDVPVARQEIAMTADLAEAIEGQASVFRETLPNGLSYLTLDMTPNGMLDNTRPFEVLANHYFVLGDNRDNSADSRVWGLVSSELLVGRAERIYGNALGKSYLGRADLSESH